MRDRGRNDPPERLGARVLGVAEPDPVRRSATGSAATSPTTRSGSADDGERDRESRQLSGQPPLLARAIASGGSTAMRIACDASTITMKTP